jgi:N-ethylmaleimide reductase
MTRCRADADAVPTPIMATYYAQRATAGLIVTEGVAPSPNGRGYARTPGLWSDAQVAAWVPVTQGVKAAGGVIFAQIMHTGRVSHPGNMPAGARVVAPSAVRLAGQTWVDALGMVDFPEPEAMTEADIAAARAEFVASARNAIAAGFDGIELHGVNGYLLEQFLSPDTNRRSDDWGGSVAKRLRFVVEVAAEVAAAIGADRVGIRISPYGTASGMGAYPEVQETYLALMAAMARVELAYVHLVDHSGQGSPAAPVAFRSALRAAWPHAFIIGGSFDESTAGQVIDSGLADLVGFGRAFIANPDLVDRLHRGLPLAQADGKTFYSAGPEGYTDYPPA